MRTSKARTGLRARLACQRRWSVYGKTRRHTPKAGAVCGKAARTDLGGGRAMKRMSLPLRPFEHVRFGPLIRPDFQGFGASAFSYGYINLPDSYSVGATTTWIEMSLN
jgi:hypothetical protein